MSEASQSSTGAFKLVSLADYPDRSRVKKLSVLPATSYERSSPRVVKYSDVDEADGWQPHYLRLHANLPEQAIYKIFDVQVRNAGHITLGNALISNNLEGAPVKRILSDLENEVAPEHHIDEPVLYLARYGMRNYGHCLTDIIPRMVWFHEHYPEIRLTMHKDTSKQIFEVLSHFGISKDSLLLLGDEHISFKEMYFVDLWNRHPLIHSPLIFEYMKQLKERAIFSSKHDTHFPKKIFVGREDAKTRKIVNQQEVSDLLTTHGFTEVACGAMSFDEQVSLFAAAESIVGVCGAAMSNMVFCEPETPVLVLSPITSPALYFWDMAHHTRLPYAIGYFPEVLRYATSSGIHANFKVNLGDLESLLQQHVS